MILPEEISNFSRTRETTVRQNRHFLDVHTGQVSTDHLISLDVPHRVWPQFVTLRFINIYFSRMLFALLVSSVASNLIGTLHPSHLSQYKNKLTTAAGLADIYYLTQFDTGKNTV